MSRHLWLLVLGMAACADVAPVLLTLNGQPVDAAVQNDAPLQLEIAPGETRTFVLEVEDANGDDVYYWWSLAPLGWEPDVLGGPAATWSVVDTFEYARGELILEGRNDDGESLHRAYDTVFAID